MKRVTHERPKITLIACPSLHPLPGVTDEGIHMRCILLFIDERHG